MTIYELKVENLKTIEEVKKYYKIAADALITAEEDMLFDEDGFSTTTIEHVKFLRELVSSLRSRVYELDTPALSDEVIDLYLDRQNHYTVCEHDASEPIGIVEFKGDEKDSGKLTCSMKKEYQGNSYSLRAIRLVGEELAKTGVFNVVVSTNEQGMPNMEEFAGMPLKGNLSYRPQRTLEGINPQTRRHSSR